jgi:hypothetical protein
MGFITIVTSMQISAAECPTANCIPDVISQCHRIVHTSQLPNLVMLAYKLFRYGDVILFTSDSQDEGDPASLVHS